MYQEMPSEFTSRETTYVWGKTIITVDTIICCIQGKIILDNILERNYYSDYQKIFTVSFHDKGPYTF